MASHKQISKIFQDVIKQFESFEGLRQCNGNKMVQQEIVDYLLVLGRLFTIMSDRAEQLKEKYSAALSEVGGYHTYGIPKAVWNAYWEMKGISSILTSLQVDLCRTLLDSSEEFASLEDFSSWMVVFFKNYSFREKVDSDFGDRCLPALNRINEQLISVIGDARIDLLSASCDEDWI